ncbi:type III-B CRISPR module RAMP protein Cmr1 [Thermus sp.]|uniref:type III-B CRISPR module RAMP protein Cmr1 n=1 Tax=Thermus sp. TaxID=275 RepID=UPI003D126442
MEHKEWKLKALTDIWTGDEERRGDRLVPTGLMGSLRWWFEVLVRGLGGKACDPTLDGVRCPDKNPLIPATTALFASSSAAPVGRASSG